MVLSAIKKITKEQHKTERREFYPARKFFIRCHWCLLPLLICIVIDQRRAKSVALTNIYRLTLHSSEEDAE